MRLGRIAATENGYIGFSLAADYFLIMGVRGKPPKQKINILKKMNNKITKFEFPDYCKATTSSLTFNEDTPYEVWESVGENLKKISGAVQLWLGDWLNFGERAYGQKYSQAMDESYYEYGSLANYASTAKRTSDARKLTTGLTLPISHWKQLATLETKEQVLFAEKSIKGNWTVLELRDAIRDKKKLSNPLMPKGKFDVILADPPWNYNDKEAIKELGGAEKHYPSMTVEQLCDMEIPSAENAILFLWVTSPLLEECFPIIHAWGFDYKTSFVWDKVKHNMGHYNSVRHEFLLVCVKGSKTPDVKKLFDSVITEERSETHSEKPKVVYEIIETLYPKGKYLELFGRKERKGWTIFGNEI
jgi:N6-adenosine-specific RNA methylase IME4